MTSRSNPPGKETASTRSTQRLSVDSSLNAAMRMESLRKRIGFAVIGPFKANAVPLPRFLHGLTYVLTRTDTLEQRHSFGQAPLMISAEELVGEEWADWYRLSPLE